MIFRNVYEGSTENGIRVIKTCIIVSTHQQTISGTDLIVLKANTEEKYGKSATF
jgi:hypothetical protein